MSHSDLKTSYGTIKLQKGTILYHVSRDKIYNIPNEPVLLTTLHPSGLSLGYIHNHYIAKIELQKDISLCFMINTIRYTYIYPAINRSARSLYKQELISHLENEKFDGWFSSVDNMDTNEIAIFNKDTDLFKFINCEPDIYDWNNRFPKNWGTTYTISTITIPLTFILNIRFKSKIESYLSYMIESNQDDTVFYKILNNAIIEYIDVPYNKLQWISDLNEKAYA